MLRCFFVGGGRGCYPKLESIFFVPKHTIRKRTQSSIRYEARCFVFARLDFFRFDRMRCASAGPLVAWVLLLCVARGSVCHVLRCVRCPFVIVRRLGPASRGWLGRWLAEAYVGTATAALMADHGARVPRRAAAGRQRHEQRHRHNRPCHRARRVWPRSTDAWAHTESPRFTSR